MTTLNPKTSSIPTHIFPLTIRIALLALLAATGVILRQIAVPTFSPFVTLTPGFTIPLLTGLVLGPIGGAVCGLIVGISGALWEPFLIPLIGNISLGLSTGLPTYFRLRIPQPFWTGLTIFLAMIFGGFLPTFCIEILVFLVPPFYAAVIASIDAFQAGIWVIVALLIYFGICEPFLRRYSIQKKDKAE